ncbi:MAG: hypothetical protein ACPG5P_05380, partial [Saprospiraceae bacterium]
FLFFLPLFYKKRRFIMGSIIEVFIEIIAHFFGEILVKYIFAPIFRFIFKTIYYTGVFIIKCITLNKTPFYEFAEASKDSVKPWVLGVLIWFVIPAVLFNL